MIANYGYKDGSGDYYISIDTDKCIDCSAGRACLTACPKEILYRILHSSGEFFFRDIEAAREQLDTSKNR